jgi:hypothetical protein
VDVREPDLSGAEALRAAYEAKALAELGDADALAGRRSRSASGHASRSWCGPVLGPPIAFVVATAAAVAEPDGVLDEVTADAASKAADALGAGPAGPFIIASRPAGAGSAKVRARRLQLAIEAVDPLAVIALDAEAAADVAAAFGLDGLPPGQPANAAGRVLGYAGAFAGSLNDDAAKAHVWSAMKAIAAAAGLHAKGRPKAPHIGSERRDGRAT